MSFPTPKYATDDEGDVYPPSEDTFLLIDALESEVELGCGSGVVSAFIRQVLAPDASSYSLATDLNFRATKCTQRTAQMNHIAGASEEDISGSGETVSARMDVVQCDLLKPLELRLRGLVDVVVFNPPYVPTEKPAGATSELYYAGGAQGRSEVDRLIGILPSLLSPTGVFYVVALRQNNIPHMLTMFEPHLRGSVVIERRCGIEHLFVLKYCKE